MTAAKALSAFLAGLSAWGLTAFVDGGLSVAELFGLIGVVGTTVAVYATPNAPTEG